MIIRCLILGVLISGYAVFGDADVNWWNKAVFYQIYPRSFKDGNNDGIGDLKGITSELEHLKDAGVTGAWLSPIYASPQVDQGYDISDYKTIDESYGTMEDFDEMLAKAKELDIAIIMDFVPNHSSDEHEWFKKSVNLSEDGAYKDYYVWQETDNAEEPPNNWLSVFGGSAWTYNEKRRAWYLHQFTPQQPDLNFREEKVKIEMQNVLKFWLDKGVDGFRLDACPYLMEDQKFEDELPSNKENVNKGEHDFLIHTYTKDIDDTYDLIYEWRQFIDDYNKNHPDGRPRILMSEAYADIKKITKYYTDGEGRDGSHIPFNFFLVSTDKESTGKDIVDNINLWLNEMPKGNYVANWVIGNHDNHRVATRVGPERADGMNMLIASLPGVMVTYNGEEIGLEDGQVPQQACQDPGGCKVGTQDYERVGRDFERTPFHWNDNINAGFNKGHKTWLPVSEKYKENNLEGQKVYGLASHYRVYQALLKLRQEDAFTKGDTTVTLPTSNVVSVKRSIENGDTYVTLVNVGNQKEKVSNILQEAKYVEVVIADSNSRKWKRILNAQDFTLEPYESIIFKPINVQSSPTYNWWKNAVFYQIYPRSFKDNNDDGIGDLKGIISKLDHLKNLGVTATWLSPICESPQVDQGYDISNYLEIDSDYGTMEDFEQLMIEAKNIGIKIIMDFVPNHSSDQHQWFKESEKKNPAYKDYYVWKDGGGKDVVPNNWISIFKYSAWKWSETRKQFYLHQFADAQPDLNYRSRALVEEMKDVVRFWLDKGVAGFRMDAVPYLVEHESFDDEPLSNIPDVGADEWNYHKHTYTSDHKGTFDVIYELRKVLDDYTIKHGGDERIMMTEAYSDIYTTMYYYGNEEYDGAQFTFNFQLIEQVNENSNANDFADAIKEWLKVMPKKYVSNWVIGNHDKPRAATRFGVENVDGINMLGAILPGVMVTYNGEEIGQENGEVTWEEGKDPSACNGKIEDFNKTSRDFQRTPFHWDNSTNAGFNKQHKPWLPVSSKYVTNNLQAQIGVPKSHYEIYRRLIQLRKNEVLVNGETSVFSVSDDVLIVDRRLSDDDRVILLFNIGDQNQNVNLTHVLATLPQDLKVVISSGNLDLNEGDSISATKIELGPYASVILETPNQLDTTSSTTTNSPTTNTYSTTTNSPTTNDKSTISSALTTTDSPTTNAGSTNFTSSTTIGSESTTANSTTHFKIYQVCLLLFISQLLLKIFNS